MRLPVHPPTPQNGPNTEGGQGATIVSPHTDKDGWPLATAVHFPDADAPLPTQHVNGFYLEARCKHEDRYVSVAQRVADPLPLSLPLASRADRHRAPRRRSARGISPSSGCRSRVRIVSLALVL